MDKNKLLVKKEVNNSIIYSLETGFSGILSIAFYVFIANYITIADVGAYSLALVYSSIFAGIANLGLSAGYERTYFEYTNDLQKKGSLISSVQFFSLISILVILFIGIFFSSEISNILFGNKSYQPLWVLILVGINISEFSKFYFAYLKNTRQAKFFSLMHFSQVAINFLLAYIFLAVLQKDLYWLGLALLLSHGLILVLCLFHQLKNIPFMINLKDFIVVAKISLPLTPRVLVGFIGTQFDKIILSQVSSLDALGIYSVAQRISMTIYMFMNALGRVWTPKLYEHLFKENLEPDTKFLSVYMYISFFPSMVLILFAKEVLMVFPENYSAGYNIIIFLSLYYSVLFVGKINGPQLIFAKKSWLLSGLSFLNIIISILVTYPLVTRYDAVGASFGMLTSGIIMGVIYFYLANKYAPLIWRYKSMSALFLFLIIATLSIFIIDKIAILYIFELIIKLAVLSAFLLYGYKMSLISTSIFR